MTNCCIAFITKKTSILPLPSLSSDFGKNFVGHLFPPHPSAKFRPNPSSFWEGICRYVILSHYNIGVKSIGFSQAIKSKGHITLHTRETEKNNMK